jgi:hypothetical protein
MQLLEVFKNFKCTTSIKKFVRKRKAIYLIQIKFRIAISYDVQFVNVPLRSQMITKVSFTTTAQVEQMPAGKIFNNRRSPAISILAVYVERHNVIAMPLLEFGN